MATAAVLPADLRAAVKAGKTVTLNEGGKAFARVVPVKRPLPWFGCSEILGSVQRRKGLLQFRHQPLRRVKS